MKKILLLLFLSFNARASNLNVLSLADVDKMSPIDKHVLMNKVEKSANAIVDGFDSFLSRKGAIRATLVGLPTIMLYCYLFPPEPVGELLGKIFNYGIDSVANVGSRVISKTFSNSDNLSVLVSSIGELEGKYHLSKELGHTQAMWDMLYEKPLATISLMASSASDKIWNSGLPFLSVILANKLFNVR